MMPVVSMGLGLFIAVALAKMGYDWQTSTVRPSSRREDDGYRS